MTPRQSVARRSRMALAALAPAAALAPPGALALDGGRRAAVLAVAAACALVGLGLAVWAWAVALRATEGAWHRALLRWGVVGLATLPLFGLGAAVLAGALSAYVVSEPVRPKPAIARWSARGFLAAAGGGVAAIAAGNLSGPNRPLHGHDFLTLFIVGVGTAAIALGAVAVGAAWWAALFNAAELDDQTWHDRLRRAGIVALATMPLLGLGVFPVAVILRRYGRDAPDATGPVERVRAPMAA